MFEDMKNLIAYTALGLLLSGCVSLTHQENNTLRSLRAQGITTEKPA